eukprot:scaffold16712_cov65-Phaeocystis_antarctica.AAC.16
MARACMRIHLHGPRSLPRSHTYLRVTYCTGPGGEPHARAERHHGLVPRCRAALRARSSRRRPALLGYPSYMVPDDSAAGVFHPTSPAAGVCHLTILQPGSVTYQWSAAGVGLYPARSTARSTVRVLAESPFSGYNPSIKAKFEATSALRCCATDVPPVPC